MVFSVFSCLLRFREVSFFLELLLISYSLLKDSIYRLNYFYGVDITFRSQTLQRCFFLVNFGFLFFYVVRLSIYLA